VHACQLVHQVRRRVPDGGSHWWIEISNGIDPSTTVVPAMVPCTSRTKLGA
jgi:hypothetical protein